MCIAVYLLTAAPLAMLAAPAGAASSGATGMYFVAMDALDVPIVDGDRADGRLRIKLVLQAADAAGVAHLDARLPELREIVLASAIEFARLYASPSSPVDARRLAADLSAALRQSDRAIVTVLVVEVAARRA